MRKGLSVLALLVAIAAFAVAVAAYLNKRSCVLCDDLDDDILSLYDDDDDCCPCCDISDAPAKETAGTDDEKAE